jgi:DNA polymerase-1
MKEYFYGELGLKEQLTRTGGQYRVTMDKHARAKLAKKYPQHKQLLSWIDDYSERRTLLSGFLRRDLDPFNRIRTSYNLCGTVTGRLSSSEPIFWPGTNLQNIPVRTKTGSKFRRLFLPDPGFSLIKADLSQAEFRLVVWLARIDTIINKYLSDPSYDIHRFVASLIYRVEEAKVTKDSNLCTDHLSKLVPGDSTMVE